MKRKGITANVLKWIAIITMIIDHFGLVIYAYTPNPVYEHYRLLRYIGRISFPIYCFLLVEGFYHTHNVKKYILRCLAFGLLSEIPFDLANSGRIFDMHSQNVYFTLATGLCTIYCLERIKGVWKVPEALAGRISVEQYRMLVAFTCTGVGAGLAQILEMDYHYMGIILIVILYYCRDYTPFVRSLIGAIVFAFEKTAPIAFIPIYFYNGERGKQNKYFFYWIYPVHLIIFWLIRYLFL